MITRPLSKLISSRHLPPAGCLTTTRVMHRFSVKFRSVFRRTLATRWQWPAVALAKVETMIDVSVETTRPMEPGSSTDEYASRKPFRAVITVRSTVIRRNFIIPVRTNGRPFNPCVSGRVDRRAPLGVHDRHHGRDGAALGLWHCADRRAEGMRPRQLWRQARRPGERSCRCTSRIFPRAGGGRRSVRACVLIARDPSPGASTANACSWSRAGARDGGLRSARAHARSRRR
jgi:hypothetical protein